MTFGSGGAHFERHSAQAVDRSVDYRIGSSFRATDNHTPSEEFRAGGVGLNMPGDDKYPGGGP